MTEDREVLLLQAAGLIIIIVILFIYGTRVETRQQFHDYCGHLLAYCTSPE
jgi:hypothetical protein